MEIWEEHLATANDNIELAKKLYSRNEAGFYRWISVMLFYSAFHFMSALMLKSGVKPPEFHKDKRNRDGSIKKGMCTYAHEYLNSCGIHYDSLFNYSWNARYFSTPHSSNSVVEKCFKCSDKIEKLVAQKIAALDKNS